MSYILDALKRADAERERGHVPGLHSQSASALSPAPSKVRRARSTPVLMAGSTILLLLLGGALWWWLSAPAGEPDAADAVQPPPAVPAPPVAEPPAAIVETPPVSAVPPAPALPILAPPPVAVPPAAMGGPDIPGTAGGTVSGVPPTGPGPDIPGALATTQPDMPTSVAPMPAPRTSVQQGGARSIASPPTPASPTSSSMPSVQVSGVTYSENRSHRMLIANGKVVHEGQEIEPGLTVEVIAPRSAVLNHRGSRYNINY